MTTSYNLTFQVKRTYLLALVFIAGNIVLPQLCHLVPQGGLRWLPIYFFTLIGAYGYGWRVGLLTAIASPLVNNMLFGMPPMPMLPVILVKSTLLAMAAALVARRLCAVSLAGVLIAVCAYQLLGAMAEWAMTSSLTAALQDVTLGLPGIMLQVIGGYLVLRRL